MHLTRKHRPTGIAPSCFGLDHERPTFRYQGRDFRLTDVHGHVVKGILA